MRIFTCPWPLSNKSHGHYDGHSSVNDIDLPAKHYEGSRFLNPLDEWERSFSSHLYLGVGAASQRSTALQVVREISEGETG